MKKVTIIAVLLFLTILQQGCSLSVGLNADSEAYWPNMKTKGGGSFGDPSMSRHEAMRPSRGSTRNNDGGNKVDAFFYRLKSMTEPKPSK